METSCNLIASNLMQDTDYFIKLQNIESSKMDVDNSQAESNLDKNIESINSSKSNKEFRESVDYYVEKDQLFEKEELASLLEKETNRLKTNQEPDSTLNDKDLEKVTGNQFNKQKFMVLPGSNLPIVDFQQYKSPNILDNNKKRKEHSFVSQHPKRKIVLQEDNIKHNLRQKEKVNYKEQSSREDTLLEDKEEESKKDDSKGDSQIVDSSYSSAE